MKIELATPKELEQEREISIIDAVNEHVIKEFCEGNKDRVLLSIDEIKNIVAMDEISESDIKLIIDSFKENKQINAALYLEGESGNKSIEFIINKKDIV